MTDQKPNEPAAAPVPVAPVAEPAVISPDNSTVDKAEFDRIQGENKKLRFDADLAKVAGTYAAATKYSKEIQEKVDKGYSVEDAALIVLNGKNELIPNTAAAPVDRSRSMGGSMDTPPAKPDEGVPAMGTPEAITYYEGKFKELEEAGEIVLS